jgi:hypothetical protein
MKFNRIRAGWYATPDGKYAVIVDGLPYISVEEYSGSGIHAGCVGGEWIAVHDPEGGLRESQSAGENIDVEDTKRQAIEACKHHAEE